MVGEMGVIHGEDYYKISFAPFSLWGSWRERFKLFIDYLDKTGFLDGKIKFFEPMMASEEEITLVHDKGYIEFVRKLDDMGRGFLDFRETVAYKGVFEDAKVVVGGTISALNLVMRGKVDHGFNPNGGFHHAKRGEAGGFCIFNDIAVAVKIAELKYKLRKIAVIDIDGHHADGTQEILYKEPVLKVSTHKYAPFFYPGTGSIYEIGEGEGKGFNINIPLPHGTGDDVFIYLFREIVEPLLDKYSPELIVAQLGADGHLNDPLVGLKLTTTSYAYVAEQLDKISHKKCKGKIVALGGGGYNPLNTAKTWIIEASKFVDSLNEGVQSKLNALMEKQTWSSEEVWREARRIVAYMKRAIFPVHGL